jgi:hypothetical protein
MRRFLKFACAISVLASFSGLALAQGNLVDVNGWSIETRDRTDGAKGNACILRSPKDGTAPTIQLVNGASPDSTRGSASLFVYVSELLVVGDKADLSNARVSIDKRKTWDVPIKWTKVSDSQGVITATLDNAIDNVIKPLAFGNALNVTFSGDDGSEKSVSVGLAGSSKALAEYEKCLSASTD